MYHKYSSSQDEEEVLNDIKARCVKTFLDIIIAFTLKIRGCLSGYKIIEHIYSKTKVLVSPSTLYPVLHQMEDKSLIEKLQVDGRGGVYKLTRKGESWLYKAVEIILKSQAYLRILNILQREEVEALTSKV